MLTTQELDEMRAVMGEAMPDTVIVQTRTRTSDGGGGFTDTWADSAAIDGRISPLAGGEANGAGDAVDARTTHVVTVAHDVTVTEDDRLKVNGTAYEVTLVRRRGGWSLARRIEVREVSA